MGNQNFRFASTTTVGGDVTLTNPSSARINLDTSIGGDLTINSKLVDTGVFAAVFGPVTIGKNFTVTAGAGNNEIGTINSTILGNSNISVGDSSGTQSLILGFASSISGDLNVQSGADTTTFDTIPSNGALQVNGNANFHFGDGVASLLPTGDINVNGNLSVTEGNGNDTTNIGQPGSTSNVNGNVVLNLGNGNDPVFVNAPVGGTVQYHSGNGNDTLVLGDGGGSTSINYRGYAVFGNGADSLALGTNGLVSGTYIGGNNPGNSFSQSYGSATATLSPFFQLINFP
jgi:hypothetical protein